MAQGQQSRAAIRREKIKARGGKVTEKEPLTEGQRRAVEAAQAKRWEDHLPVQEMAKHANVSPQFTDYALVKRILANQRQIVEAAQAEMVTGAPLAAKFLLNVIRGDVDGASVTNRVEAAKIVLTATGTINSQGNSQQQSKDINGLPLHELRAFIDAGSARLAELKKEAAAHTIEGGADS